jgi:hypothetical protein
MFIQNSVATMDASLYTIIQTLGNLDYVFIYDREPRNKDVCRNIEKTIDLGFSICLFPETMVGKDINEYVMNGILPENLMSLVTKYTYQGLRAKLEYSQWKKI